MRKVLRSILWTTSAEKQPATENFGKVRRDRLLGLRTAEAELLDFMLDFYQRQGEAPQGQLVFDHFDQLKNTDAVVLIEEVLVGTFYEGASFKDLFEDEVELQAAANFTGVAKQAVKIATEGLMIGKQRVKGVDDAVAFLYSSAKVTPKDEEGQLPASMKEGKDGLNDLYRQRAQNPAQTYGILTGYGLIDSSTAGIRKKQLHLHVGFVGHLKSTHMLNMVVNAVVDGGWNEMIFTSEMPADDLKLMLVAIHSANPRFAGVHRPLNSFKMLLGGLTPQEEAFYQEVHEDLVSNPNHGSIRVVDSGSFTTVGSVMERTIREHQKEEVDQIWIDYPMRLPVDFKYRAMDIVSARNEELADLKRFAMSFDRGKGLAVSCPFQMNREGYRAALANGGRVSKTALAQYNAAEKEADVISYIWFDKDEIATSEPKLGLLKSRWGAVGADPVPLFIEPDSRRIVDMTAGMNVQTGYAPTAAASGSDEVVL